MKQELGETKEKKNDFSYLGKDLFTPEKFLFKGDNFRTLRMFIFTCSYAVYKDKKLCKRTFIVPLKEIAEFLKISRYKKTEQIAIVTSCIKDLIIHNNVFQFRNERGLNLIIIFSKLSIDEIDNVIRFTFNEDIIPYINGELSFIQVKFKNIKNLSTIKQLHFYLFFKSLQLNKNQYRSSTISLEDLKEIFQIEGYNSEKKRSATNLLRAIGLNKNGSRKKSAVLGEEYEYTTRLKENGERERVLKSYGVIGTINRFTDIKVEAHILNDKLIRFDICTQNEPKIEQTKAQGNEVQEVVTEIEAVQEAQGVVQKEEFDVPSPKPISSPKKITVIPRSTVIEFSKTTGWSIQDCINKLGYTENADGDFEKLG